MSKAEIGEALKVKGTDQRVLSFTHIYFVPIPLLCTHKHQQYGNHTIRTNCLSLAARRLALLHCTTISLNDCKQTLRSSNRPSRSVSLYRLSYSGPRTGISIVRKCQLITDILTLLFDVVVFGNEAVTQQLTGKQQVLSRDNSCFNSRTCPRVATDVCSCGRLTRSLPCCLKTTGNLMEHLGSVLG
jgi:hypothetical protein